MAAPTFLEVLKAETMKFQATHPEREAEIARASALIRLGMVTPSPGDPATGQVLSSDGQKVYHVNGTCDCDAGQHGRACKHMSGWKLYQHIEGKMAAQATPDDFAFKGKNSPLYEAPVSASVHLTLAGHDVLFTMRDRSEAALLERLEAVLTQYPQPQPPAPSQGQEGWCSKHSVQMKWNDGRDGRKGWYSHRSADGQWCKGK